MPISLIIPTYNEAQRIVPLVRYLKAQGQKYLLEIIVADAAASTDNTLERLKPIDGVVAFRADDTRRSQQLNQAAAKARGDILYFVHADTQPPASFASDIQCTLEKGNDFGLFSYQFDSSSWLLRVNSRTTKYENIFTGGGDQTLFLRRELFEKMGGFRSDLVIMEDFDLFWRLRKAGYRYTIVDNPCLVSARKYNGNGYLKVNLVNLCTFSLFKLGFCQYRLKRFYKWALGGR